MVPFYFEYNRFKYLININYHIYKDLLLNRRKISIKTFY